MFDGSGQLAYVRCNANALDKDVSGTTLCGTDFDGPGAETPPQGTARHSDDFALRSLTVNAFVANPRASTVATCAVVTSGGLQPKFGVGASTAECDPEEDNADVAGDFTHYGNTVSFTSTRVSPASGVPLLAARPQFLASLVAQLLPCSCCDRRAMQLRHAQCSWYSGYAHVHYLAATTSLGHGDRITASTADEIPCSPEMLFPASLIRGGGGFRFRGGRPHTRVSGPLARHRQTRSSPARGIAYLR